MCNVLSAVCSGHTAGPGRATWGVSLKARLGHPSPIPHSVYLQNDADPNVSEQQTFLVVVAIDFGTTSSGYAYSFTKEPECIHVMRSVLWQGGAGAGTRSLHLQRLGGGLWGWGRRGVVQ